MFTLGILLQQWYPGLIKNDNWWRLQCPPVAWTFPLQQQFTSVTDIIASTDYTAAALEYQLKLQSTPHGIKKNAGQLLQFTTGLFKHGSWSSDTHSRPSGSSQTQLSEEMEIVCISSGWWLQNTPLFSQLQKFWFSCGHGTHTALNKMFYKTGLVTDTSTIPLQLPLG